MPLAPDEQDLLQLDLSNYRDVNGVMVEGGMDPMAYPKGRLAYDKNGQAMDLLSTLYPQDPRTMPPELRPRGLAYDTNGEYPAYRGLSEPLRLRTAGGVKIVTGFMFRPPVAREPGWEKNLGPGDPIESTSGELARSVADLYKLVEEDPSCLLYTSDAADE